MKLHRVLIANRGEIAVRIIRACRVLGIEAVLAVSEADRDSLPARLADQTICIGAARPLESYLDVNSVVMAAVGSRCDAIHPGYGFLAENPALAEACNQAGIVFIGPRAETIRQMGNKVLARELAVRAGVPVVPGSAKVASLDEALLMANKVGWPVLLKAAAGGGGRGMKVVEDEQDMKGAFEIATVEAQAAFGDGAIYVERFIRNARHVEVQILADSCGNVINLGERDCTLQRRHQKIVEEAPAASVSEELRRDICRAAVDLAAGICYENAGTVEFIVDQDRQEFFFMEVNTRIQVEHTVTEAVTGIDLVAEQIRIAAGEPLTINSGDVCFSGHAIECRINAESAQEGFRPSPGKLSAWRPPAGEFIRVDTHCFPGYIVPPYYDSLLAKLIVFGADRTEAITRMQAALEEFTVEGVDTTIPFLKVIMRQPEYHAGKVSTRWVEGLLVKNEEMLP